ncbi:MAG: hypothetical protein RMZ42_08145 [Nostoc sp. DedQUE05]|nr:hypothetical protein [Nostoc sp. DedQUE05]MDZ8091899.1 hypothetical protein [Nostoc sp. DedQUE05]
MRYQQNRTTTNRQLLTQRCKITQQPIHSAWSSLLYETLRERHNWLVIH